MSIARYKYAATTATEVSGLSIADGQQDGVQKDLAGSIGVLFQVICSYGAGATRGLELRVTQSVDAVRPYDSDDAASLAFEMPYAAPGARITTVPVLLPEVGPRVKLLMINNTGASVTVTVCSRLIEGVEVV